MADRARRFDIQSRFLFVVLFLVLAPILILAHLLSNGSGVDGRIFFVVRFRWECEGSRRPHYDHVDEENDDRDHD